MSSLSDYDDEDDEEQPCIVIDIGSQTCRAGFGGDDEPRYMVTTVLSRDSEVDEWGIGNEVGGEESHEVRYPVRNGVVEDWDGMEKILQHLFTEKLRVDPEKYNVMICDSSISPKEKREKMAEVLFEKFKVAGIFFAFQNTLSLYACGKLTGTVIDLGYQHTTIDVILYGNPLPQPYFGKQLPIGGYHITNRLMELLDLDHYMTDDRMRRSTALAVKESMCRVALDFDAEVSAFTDDTKHQYKLPDGNTLSIGDEMIRATELLFDPSSGGVVDCVGVHQAVFDLIDKRIDSAERVALYGDIVLSGGTSLFPGLQQRLTKEVTALAPTKIHRKDVHVKVTANPERGHSAWIGGSILGSLSSFEEQWVTKAEYEEEGPSVLRKKCCM